MLAILFISLAALLQDASIKRALKCYIACLLHANRDREFVGQPHWHAMVILAMDKSDSPLGLMDKASDF